MGTLLVALCPADARCGSLSARASTGDVWQVISDPSAGAQGYLLEHRLRGGLDAQFGTGGRCPVAISATDDAPTALRVDANGRIWIVGASVAGGEPQTVVLRLLPNGSPDIRWGVQGRLQVSPAGLAIKPNDLMPLSDGSLLVAGVASNVEPTRAAVFHLNANGLLDETFARAGIWQRPVAKADGAATALAVRDDGGVAVSVIARGDQTVVEIWSIGRRAQALVLQRSDAAGEAGDSLGLGWSGREWQFASNLAPTTAGVVATLEPERRSPAAGSAASPPSEPGQSGFSPFSESASVQPLDDGRGYAGAGDAERDRGTLWVVGLVIALAVALLVLVHRRREARRVD